MSQLSLPTVIQGSLITYSDSSKLFVSENLSPTVVAIIAVISTAVIFAFILNKLIGLNRTILVIGALICGCVGFLVGTDFLRDLEYNTENKSEFITDTGVDMLGIDVGYVFFAAQDIPRGTEPYEGMYTALPLPYNLIMEFYIQDEYYIDGSLAVADIKRGMILTTDLLVNTSFEHTDPYIP